MKFIHTADWHIGKGQAYIPHTVERTLDAIDAVYAKAAELGIYTVVQAGDVFDSPSVSDQDRYTFAHKLLSLDEAGFRTLIIPGNHDEIDKDLSALSYLSLLTEQGRFNRTVVANKTKLVVVDGTGFLLFASEPWGSLDQHIDQVCEGSLDLDLDHLVVVAHTPMIGSTTSLGKVMTHGSEFKSDPRVTYCAYGDIHKYQRVGPRAYYSGAPLQTDFGEVCRTGVLVVDLDEPDDPNFVEIPSIRLATVNHGDPIPENSYACIVYDDDKSEDKVEKLPPSVIKKKRKVDKVDLTDIQTAEALFSGIEQILEKRGLNTEEVQLAKQELDNAIVKG